MPIVITRSTGEVSTTKLTPEQSQKAWDVIVRALAEKHPEILKEEKQ